MLVLYLVQQTEVQEEILLEVVELRKEVDLPVKQGVQEVEEQEHVMVQQELTV